MNTVALRADNKVLRQFGFAFAFVISVLFGLLFPWVLDNPIPLWPWVIAALFFLLAVISPSLLRRIYGLWMHFSFYLGWLNTRIILSVIYYSLFTLAACVMKIVGRDPLTRRIKPELKSYFVESVAKNNQHMENPY